VISFSGYICVLDLWMHSSTYIFFCAEKVRRMPRDVQRHAVRPHCRGTASYLRTSSQCEITEPTIKVRHWLYSRIQERNPREASSADATLVVLVSS
jgi:hypothetical protein